MNRAAVFVTAMVLLIACGQNESVSKASALPGANVLPAQQDFTVYNDFRTDNFIIVFQSPRAGKASVSVYYEDGKLFSRRDFAVNKGPNTWSYKQKFASSGIYIVKLLMNDLQRSAKLYKKIN